ncbi:hypothetical protein [Streptomyces sp. GbtcB7]|uniref:hypothetical protein n=1 Tax=Streptomyces sp. GbtcB7 TaxID=2824752 RepID=UPI001C311207|nr:hypothetical protein [Streptomyces sp. GbtcB7]
MSMTGWRVHLPHRDLAWPREGTSFIREFSALIAGLDLRLDDLGVSEGQPFLISPAGQYDVALNRYFPVWPASSPWNTQAAHARDRRTFFDVLWFARDRCDWREATVDDRAAYEWWRRRDDDGPRVEDAGWDREVSTVTARRPVTTCGVGIRGWDSRPKTVPRTE